MCQLNIQSEKKANCFQQLLGKEYKGENIILVWSQSLCDVLAALSLKGDSAIRRDAEKSPLAHESNELWKNVLKSVGILETKLSQARWGNFLLDKNKQRTGWFSLWGEVTRGLLQRLCWDHCSLTGSQTTWKRRWEGKICWWHGIWVAVRSWGSCSDGLRSPEWLQGWMAREGGMVSEMWSDAHLGKEQSHLFSCSKGPWAGCDHSGSCGCSTRMTGAYGGWQAVWWKNQLSA